MYTALKQNICYSVPHNVPLVGKQTKYQLMGLETFKTSK